ncbi:DMT family transporter [Eggerthella sinensis]|uniref:DMT family transporter n=1 Tax=Eggerthella sinensis TaxID=242230 RepID=UPI0022E4BFDA|nr:DMT family transporter [Eggerthella sinensis]
MRVSKGVYYGLAAAFCFGMMPVWAKLAYGAGLDPLALVMLRTLMAGIVLLAFFATKRRVPRIDRAAWRTVAGTCCLYAAMMISYFTACQNLDSGVANALFHLYPVIVMVLTAVLRRSELGAGKWVAAALAVAGFVLLANYGGGVVSARGIALVSAAAVLFACYSLMLDTPRISAVDPFVLTFYVCIASCVASSALWLLSGPGSAMITLPGLGYALLIGLFSTVFALALYIMGTRQLGSAVASMLSNAEVVVTLLAGVLVLGETVEASTVAGCVLIVLACVLVCVRGHEWRKPDTAEEGKRHVGI